MPRTGKHQALGLLGVLLAACLACAGCTSGRDFLAVDGSGTPVPSSRLTRPIGYPPSADGMVVQAGASEVVAGPISPMPPPWSACGDQPVEHILPREKEKVTHPAYVIEPPDILILDAVRLVPRPPYKVEPLDALAIVVTNTLPKAPIEGIYTVEASGSVNLGYTYGTVPLIGQTLEEAKKSIEAHLKQHLKPPFEVQVTLAESRAMQQVRGEHLVRQDGTVGLGIYGSVNVTGLTIAQAKAAIEEYLSQYLFQPKVSVDVAGFNSHVYYVIFDYPGTGQTVFRLPVTGNETVLDALGDMRGLPAGVSKRRIWVARPAPAKSGRVQILPVDWYAITRNAQTATNYQIMPGDRIFVAPDPLSAVDATLARIFSPVERVLGITLLGNSVLQSLRNQNGLGGTTGTR